MKIKQRKECSVSAAVVQVGYRKSKLQTLKRYMPFYIMFAPVLIFYLTFAYAPMVGLIMAFKDYNFMDGMFASPWAGLAHFERFVSNGDFWRVLGNTLSISFLRIAFSFPAPIALALMLNEVHHPKYKKFVQTATYLPHFISWVILSGIIITLLRVDGGIVNQLIQKFGGEPVAFLSDNRYFVPTLIVANIWKGAGWGTIIYLAALSGIDVELYEAAMIDGANRWHRMIYITLPGIVGAISIQLIMQLSHILSAGFDQIFNLYSPLVYDTADIIDTYVYRIGLINGKYEMATALGLFKSVVAFILIVASNKIIQKLGGDGIW